MVNVDPAEGIVYGFRLIGYALGVFIIGFILFGVGGVLLESDSPILGGIILLFGFLTIFAGFLGVNYKIVADAVEKGMNASNVGDVQAQRQQGQRQGGQQRRGGQQQRSGRQQQQRSDRQQQQRGSQQQQRR